MDTMIMVFVGVMCLMLGMRVYNAEEQNKIFTKYPIKVKDVKKYNHACGALIIVFGVVAEITLFLMVCSEGIMSTVYTAGIIVEAILVMVVYRQIEKKCMVK